MSLSTVWHHIHLANHPIFHDAGDARVAADEKARRNRVFDGSSSDHSELLLHKHRIHVVNTAAVVGGWLVVWVGGEHSLRAVHIESLRSSEKENAADYVILNCQPALQGAGLVEGTNLDEFLQLLAYEDVQNGPPEEATQLLAVVCQRMSFVLAVDMDGLKASLGKTYVPHL